MPGGEIKSFIDWLTAKMIRKNKDQILNKLVSRLPDYLTPDALIYFRIFVTLILFILFLEKADNLAWWLILIYLIGKITDLLDGSLARWRGQATFFGENLDPLADRLLNLVALIIIISLWHLGSLWLYFFVNLVVIIMIITDLFFALMKIFWRLVYFRKIFEALGFLTTLILLIIELLKK